MRPLSGLHNKFLWLKASVASSAIPPLAAVYHFIAVPTAVRFATVGLSIAQKDCVALPVGADGLLIVTVTCVLVSLIQPLSTSP